MTIKGTIKNKVRKYRQKFNLWSYNYIKIPIMKYIIGFDDLEEFCIEYEGKLGLKDYYEEPYDPYDYYQDKY